MAQSGFGLEDVEYMKRETLINILRDKKNKKYIIIDVRDNDYIGGHIIGSVNIPHISIEKHWADIVSKYNSTPLIIFHCQYSEIRAPAAYQRYTFLLKSIIGLYNKLKQQKEESKDDETIKFQSIEFTLNNEIINNLSNQTIKVLEGGFYGWVCYCIKNQKDLELIDDFDKKMYCSNK
eukprot:164962_1